MMRVPSLYLTVVVMVPAVALLAALRTVFDQRKTIALLREEIHSTVSDLPPLAPQPVPESVHAEPPLPLPPSPQSPIQSAEKLPLQEAVITNAPLELPSQSKEELERELQLAQAHSTGAEQGGPRSDPNERPYIGPGTWINQDPQSRGIKKVIISGQVDLANASPGMTIQLSASYSLRDSEAGVVPLFLVDDRSQPRLGWRGFAIWEQPDGWNQYAIVTFEKAGLKLDTIYITKQPLIYHFSKVVRLSRVN